MTTILILVSSYGAALVVGSFFEWALHKFLMHGVLIKGYPYHRHDRIHHVEFGSGPDYVIRDATQRNRVSMAWWNAPLLLLANAPLPILVSWLVGSWWVLPGAMAGFLCYYAGYEYLHWCMHVPRPRWFQRTRFFRSVDRHHRIHHEFPMRNLNVFLPFADYLLGTRLHRAPVPQKLVAAVRSELPLARPASAHRP